MIFASFWNIAAEHIASFGGGLLIGFWLSNRYRLVPRDGKGGDNGQLRRPDRS